MALKYGVGDSGVLGTRAVFKGEGFTDLNLPRYVGKIVLLH